MRVQQLAPDITNFQVGYLHENLTNEVFSPAPKQIPLPQFSVQFLGLSLNSQKRRVIFRRSLSGTPDVPSVLPCDLRVQQLLSWSTVPEFPASTEGKQHSNEDLRVSTTNKSTETGEVGGSSSSSEVGSGRTNRTGGGGGDTDSSAVSGKHLDYYGDGMSQESEDDGTRKRTDTEQAAATVEGVTTSGRKWNDYRREIDLAHHILQMEHGGGGDDDEDGGGGGGATEQHTTALFQRVPSTVRFNDALVCTSKDLQILKSGAIKMMRLTVICHSDLHYQNHSWWKHHQRSQQRRKDEEKYFGNETAPKDTVLVDVPFAKPTTNTTTAYSSATSSVQVTTEKDGKCEKEPRTSTTISSPTTQTTFHEKRGKEEPILVSSSSSSSPPNSSHHHSNHKEKSTLPLSFQEEASSSSKTNKNWNRLAEKIRNIFQTYDIHVGPRTLVNLKGCPLASFQTNFSPAIRFLFVEECEIVKKKSKEENENNATTKKSDLDIGRVSGKTEIIITNVHHISHYHRLVEMEESSKQSSSSPGEENVHLYGLEHAAKILNGMIKRAGVGQVENPVVPVSYTTTPSSPNSGLLLTEFSHGLLISGPSGCGKVVVVRETAKKLGAHLLSFNPVVSVEKDAPRFCQQLTEIFTSALVTASRYQTLLLFPRIHLIFQGMSTANNSPSFSTTRNSKQRVLHHLCQLFDSIPGGCKLTVVGTTDKAFLVPLQLRRAGRLEKEIIISPPKESDRLAILKELSRNIPAFRNVDFEEFASLTPGYVGQDLLKVLRLALFKSQEEDAEEVSETHLKYAVVPSVLEGALGVVDIQRANSLDHIAGLHSVKLDLIKAIVWPLKHPEAFLRMGISPPKGILLYGPLGNAKTTLVRAVAATHQTNFLSVSAAELFSSGVGDSEKIVAHLFHRARMASPCILFIDELESIVGSRQNSEKKQTGTNESILSMLLTEMDGVGTARIHQHSSTTMSSTDDDDPATKGTSQSPQSLGPLVLVVAATNRPDLIDPALLRPGRFDKLIGVPPLDLNGRRELLEWCSKSIPFRNVDFQKVAESTEYFSGADLVNLCREAALFALSESLSAPFVTDKHVTMARSVVGPSLNPEMVRAFHEYGSSQPSEC